MSQSLDSLDSLKCHVFSWFPSPDSLDSLKCYVILLCDCLEFADSLGCTEDSQSNTHHTVEGTGGGNFIRGGKSSYGGGKSSYARFEGLIWSLNCSFTVYIISLASVHISVATGLVSSGSNCVKPRLGYEPRTASTLERRNVTG